MKSYLKSIIVKILIKEATWLLSRHKPTIICITGSVGKTTTKDAVYAAIKNSISARKSEKSFNSEIGVPLTILGLNNAWSNPLRWIKNIFDGLFVALFSNQYPAVLVLEAGIDRPGDMERLMAWLKPDIGVLTTLPAVPVHVEYFSDPNQVADEKMKLVAGLKPEGTFIYNADDTIITSRLDEVLQRSWSFGRYLACDFKASEDRVIYNDDKPTGFSCLVEHAGQRGEIRLADTLGSQHVYSTTAAVAVADALGISIKDAIAGLGELRSPNGRLRIIPGIKGTTILDDTYNASPAAVAQAVEALKEIQYATRKIAVLGDMLELGRFSTEEHSLVGRQVAFVADKLILAGVRTRAIAEAALAAGMDESDILQYDDAADVAREIQNIIAPGDVVLIKASQGIRAERIVEEIMAEPNRAAELLVRQESEWLKLR